MTTDPTGGRRRTRAASRGERGRRTHTRVARRETRVTVDAAGCFDTSPSTDGGTGGWGGDGGERA